MFGSKGIIMSKPLSIAATLSVLATAAMALAMMTAEPAGGRDKRGPAAHGSLIEVLVRA
ncbi:hypothetical protein [Qipengyuania sp.]|uniref:hypothetical protein n=1 Tax=Qipengyuania sp. TaxID=2004515 RepID=UPI0035C78C23